MNYSEIAVFAASVIGSIGGGALIVAKFSSWLGGIWATRMLQDERALHSEKLESIKSELELIKHKGVTRHNDKLNVYREVIQIVSEILKELEGVALGIQKSVNNDAERCFSTNRHKAYGYLSLVSNQEVMDKYNELVDYLMPIVYEGKLNDLNWAGMRNMADKLLNAMRTDLGINEGEITYRGSR